MPISFQCSQCGRTLAAPDTHAGQQAYCHHCGQDAGIIPAIPTASAESTTTSKIIHFSCSSCQGHLRAARGFAGKRIKCPRCGHILRVPAVAEAPAAVKPAARPAQEAALQEERPGATRAPLLNWEILGGDSAAREAGRQGVKPRLANPDVFAAALLTPTALPDSNFVNLVGVIGCNGCRREFEFQAEFVLGAELGGAAKCPCGNRFTWLTAKEKRASGVFFMVYPDAVPARGSGGAVTLQVTGITVRPASPGAAAPTNAELPVRPTPGKHSSPLLFRGTCSACGEDAWDFAETLLLVRTAGWELLEDTVVPLTGAETTAADYEDRKKRRNAPGTLRPLPADPLAAALDNRKGFECTNRLCRARFCQDCLRAEALRGGRESLLCLECGEPVRRIADGASHYSDEWGEFEQARVAEIAASVFDFATNRFRYPLLLTQALSSPLLKSADGSVVGGGWRELNEELRRKRTSRQDALLAAVLPGNAFAGVSRSLRTRIPHGALGTEGYLRPILLALALFADYRLVDGRAGTNSYRLEVSSRLRSCRADTLTCGYFLGTIVYRSLLEEFGGGEVTPPGSAGHQLVLSESECITAALLKKYAPQYDFYIIRR